MELNGSGANPTLVTFLLELSYKEKPTELDMKPVIKTIQAHREASEDENPMVSLGKIKNGALADKTTWWTLSNSLTKGLYSLKDDPEWQRLNKKHDGKLTLAKLKLELVHFSVAEDDMAHDTPQP